MKLKTAAWLAFFRLPNLPTAPGDALAGAAIALSVSQDFDPSFLEPMVLRNLLAAGAAALFVYMFGLADNDIVGAEEDRTHAPKRPIPTGTITLSQARVARGLCLALAILVAVLCKLPPYWWGAAALLLGNILLYNRQKNRWPVFGLVAMGLCRGLSLLAGAVAMQPFTAGQPVLALPAVWLAVLGWTAYISVVTWLAADEHAASTPMSPLRFLPGLTVFIPLTAMAVYPQESWLLMGACSFCAYGIWVASVLPLGREHTPEIRRRAVGGAIGAIIYLQAGFMLAYPNILLVTLVFAIFISNAFIRKFLVGVPGS